VITSGRRTRPTFLCSTWPPLPVRFVRRSLDRRIAVEFCALQAPSSRCSRSTPMWPSELSRVSSACSTRLCGGFCWLHAGLAESVRSPSCRRDFKRWILTWSRYFLAIVLLAIPSLLIYTGKATYVSLHGSIRKPVRMRAWSYRKGGFIRYEPAWTVNVFTVDSAYTIIKAWCFLLMNPAPF